MCNINICIYTTYVYIKIGVTVGSAHGLFLAVWGSDNMYKRSNSVNQMQCRCTTLCTQLYFWGGTLSDNQGLLLAMLSRKAPSLGGPHGTPGD